MIPPQLVIAGAIAAVSAATGFGAAWKWQAHRMDSMEKTYVEQALVNERSAAKQAIRQSDAVIAAQNVSAARAASLRRDADGVRTAIVGLSASADTALRDSATSQAACLDTSTKLKIVFLECSGKYEAVARSADLWENDAVTLRDAWPK